MSHDVKIGGGSTLNFARTNQCSTEPYVILSKHTGICSTGETDDCVEFPTMASALKKTQGPSQVLRSNEAPCDAKAGQGLVLEF